jgi:hypothetical protein
MPIIKLLKPNRKSWKCRNGINGSWLVGVIRRLRNSFEKKWMSRLLNWHHLLIHTNNYKCKNEIGFRQLRVCDAAPGNFFVRWFVHKKRKKEKGKSGMDVMT